MSMPSVTRQADRRLYSGCTAFLRDLCGCSLRALRLRATFLSHPRSQGIRAGIIRYSKLVGAALLCASSVVAQSPNAPLPPGDAKEKAEAACLACHEARIIVQQRLSKVAWTKELDKMIKWGAEVDPKDRDALIDYFSANFNADQPIYEAPKTANESKKKNTKH